MNTTTKEYNSQEYKQCAGMGCHNPPVQQLEVLYIMKIGWFCEQCRNDLMVSGLVKETDRVKVKNSSGSQNKKMVLEQVERPGFNTISSIKR